MLFGATLKNTSPVYRNWRAQKLLTGHLEGVPFRYTGVHYVVDSIPGESVTALLAHNNVTVHVIAPAPVPVVVPVPDDEPEDDLSRKCIQTSDKPVASKPRGRPPLSRK